MQGSTVDYKRLVLISGPSGFDAATALFAEGVELRDDDMLASIERPGNVEVQIFDGNRAFSKLLAK
jgi:hypothetical protein